MTGPELPKAPYREGKPLTEIIAPDHRRLKISVLVASSMIAGVVLWVAGGRALDAVRSSSAAPAPSTPGYIAGRIGSAVLHGPDQDVVMPPATLSIIHVWLQGCQDCMPAFEAMRRLEDDGGLGVDVPIYNVAYGEADPTWATRYGVRANLAYDAAGTNVVRPLGIGTFTTLVVDRGGAILLRDRPDRPGYRARVRAAVHAEDPRDSPQPSPDRSDDAEFLDGAAVERVVAAHRSGLTLACWGNRPAAERSTAAQADVTVLATVGSEGMVVSTSASGSDAAVARCVERQIKTWRFPDVAKGERTVTVSIPFRFSRQ